MSNVRQMPPQGPQGPDFRARRDRILGPRLVTVGAGEAILGTAHGWPNADGYVDPQGDGGAVGAKLKLYAIAAGIRTLEASAVIGAGAPATRISAAGRGCDLWELTITPDPAQPPSTKNWMTCLTTFDGAATASSVLPSGGTVAPGLASWADFYAASGVVKAAPAQLVQVFGNVINVGAPPEWLHIFDDTAPRLNATPKIRAALTPNGQFSIVLADAIDPASQPGRTFAVGIAWGVSTNPQTFTNDNAALLDIHFKYL